ncbi:MAG: hypothetical protein WD316_12215 [Phycisphaeraceae bacterium]
MPHRRRDIVDITGLRPSRERAGLRGRPWIAVRWDCCSAYSRVYRNQAGTAYEGRCPRCMRAIRVRVGPGGTNHRFFIAQ